jgi:glycosyltransferase involved in cell wall biosynthesis
MIEPRSVSVITATRKRTELLRGAIDSVARQCCGHVAEHLILVDDCSDTAEMLAGLRSPLVRSVVIPRQDDEATGVYRLAELRDLGAQMATAPWLAFIDDDNEWEPTHLHELLATAEETGSPAVHSWRAMTYRDQTPYVLDVFPWAKDEETGRAEYWRRVRLGAFTPDSNVYRDGIGTEVDAGEWLLATDLVRRLTFQCVLDDEEVVNRIGEDDKFLEKLLAAHVPIACTERPTLIYRVGGESNFGHGTI